MNIVVDPGALIATITIVAGITIFSFLRSRHIERMQQLQLGIPINGRHNDHLPIKMGMLFIGVGMGILIAYILDCLLSRSVDELYAAFIFLFGGIGLITSYVIVRQIAYKE